MTCEEWREAFQWLAIIVGAYAHKDTLYFANGEYEFKPAQIE